MQDVAELQRRGFNRDQISEYVDLHGQGLKICDRVQDLLRISKVPFQVLSKTVVMIPHLQERLIWPEDVKELADEVMVSNKFVIT